MNDRYLKLAGEKITDRNILISIASKRAKELARGANAMVPVDRSGEVAVNYLDVALREISEGKISFEIES